MNPFRWLSSAPKTRPILLRLDLGGQPCPPSVEVEAEWLPSQTRASERLLSASSMVLLPWRGDSQRAVLSIRVGDRIGRAVVTREDNRDGPVLDVRMAAI